VECDFDATYLPLFYGDVLLMLVHGGYGDVYWGQLFYSVFSDGVGGGVGVMEVTVVTRKHC